MSKTQLKIFSQPITFLKEIYFQNFLGKTLTLFYVTFQCGRYKDFNLFFFAHGNLKKRAYKVAHNQPKSFFDSNDNRLKSNPNLNSCSIKSPTTGLFCNNFGCNLQQGKVCIDPKILMHRCTMQWILRSYNISLDTQKIDRRIYYSQPPINQNPTNGSAEYLLM